LTKWIVKSSSGTFVRALYKPPMLTVPANDRLKKVQGKKKRDTEAAEAKRIAELAAQDLESGTTAPTAPSADVPVDDESTADNLLSTKDVDVIF